MKKTSRIIAFILLIALLFTGMGMTYKNVVKNVNLGLDLQGGFEVLFQVDPLNKGDKCRTFNRVGIVQQHAKITDTTDTGF